MMRRGEGKKLPLRRMNAMGDSGTQQSKLFFPHGVLYDASMKLVF